MKIQIMDFFKRVYSRIFTKIKYIIVDFEEKSKKVTFVCYGTRAFFKMPLVEIPYDEKIIAGLDPRQSCFLGVKIGQYIDVEISKFKKSTSSGSSIYYNSNSGVDLSFDRYGNVIFFDKKTGNPECIPAINIVKNDSILKNMSPSASYAIGVLVGKNIRIRGAEYFSEKLNDPNTNIINIANLKR